MYHRTTGTSIGHTFSVDSSETKQFVTLNGVDTKVEYYNLSDGLGNNVGRVFPQYKMFTLDDQELVAAMSYKSNRNWTLPTLLWDVTSGTDGVIDSTQVLYVTYLLANGGTGYTTGLHCQNYIKADFTELSNCESCLGTNKKIITVEFPLDQLPYMNTTGTTGWYADELYMLVQKVTKDSNGIVPSPDPSNWKMIDVTSNINGHTLGQKIDPANLENTVFNITNTLYTGGTAYDLNNFITIPGPFDTFLGFGDEYFFHGGLTTKALTTKYRTKFSIAIPPSMFNTTTNPTHINSGQNVHISEFGIYNNNDDLVAVGKFNLPIEKASNTTIIVEMAFDL